MATARTSWWRRLISWFLDWQRCPWAAVMLCAGIASGQGVRVVFDDGSMADQLGLGKRIAGGIEIAVGEPLPGRYRVRLRNPGRPEWQVNRPQVGDRVWIRDVYVGCPPGFSVEWAAPKQAVDAGFDLEGMRVWHVLGPQHRRSVFPLIAESKSKHVLTGGESVWWDLVKAAPTLPARDDIVAARARVLLWQHSEFDLARWPERERLHSLWRITPASFDPKAGDRDMGWRMRWWAARFAGNADGTTRVPEAIGPFDWGGMRWTDGHSAQHYDLPRWGVERYLETGDPGAWAFAYLTACYWASQCFIWTDTAEPFVQHAVRYEKGYSAAEGGAVPKGGELGRPGNGGDSPPRVSHMWDAGVRLVAHLSGDRDLLEVCRLRGEYVLRSRPALTPNGCRGFGWNLDNAIAHGWMTGDARFRTFAAAEAARAVAAAWPLGKSSSAGALPAWPSETRLNERGLVEWDPWQHAIVVEAIMRASGLLGFVLAPSDAAAIVAIGTHTLEQGTRFVPGPSGATHYLQGCMYRDRAYNPTYPDGLMEIWQGPALSANYLGLTWIAASHDPARWGARWQACVRTCGELCFTGFGGTVPPPQVQRQADSNYWGLAGHKAMADLMFARPWFFVPPQGVVNP